MSSWSFRPISCFLTSNQEGLNSNLSHYALFSFWRQAACTQGRYRSIVWQYILHAFTPQHQPTIHAASKPLHYYDFWWWGVQFSCTRVAKPDFHRACWAYWCQNQLDWNQNWNQPAKLIKLSVGDGTERVHWRSDTSLYTVHVFWTCNPPGNRQKYRAVKYPIQGLSSYMTGELKLKFPSDQRHSDTAMWMQRLLTSVLDALVIPPITRLYAWNTQILYFISLHITKQVQDPAG